MRVTKYVKSDGENWIVCKLRCSAHVAYARLDSLMRQNGWIRWQEVKTRFDILRKKLAKANPIKYPNWREVQIPMRAAKLADIPKQISAENLEKIDDRSTTANDTATTS